MIIKPKNYPHPVLAPYSDDIASSPTNCNVDIEWDKSYYYLKYELSIYNDTIAELLRADSIHFIIHVECSKTFYRKAVRIDACDFIDYHTTGTITIPAKDIKDNTEVSIFVCATSQVADYMPAGMHPDYGTTAFGLENGDFVAVWKTYKFDLYQDYDPIQKVDSIISFQRDNDRETGEITISVNADKLTAYLPKDMHSLYKNLCEDKSKEDIIVAMMGIPILMEGLAYIKENTLAEDGVLLTACRRYRWFRSLEKKLSDLNIDIKSQENMFVAAQKVLENPCKRAGKAFEKIDENQS